MRFDPIDPAQAGWTRRLLLHGMSAVGTCGRAVWRRNGLSRSTWFDKSRVWRGIWNVNRLFGCLPRAQSTHLDVKFERGMTMRLDLTRLTDVLCFMYGPGEGEVGYIADRLCDPRGTVLDVGTNVGTTAIYFATCVPHGTVHAFEPSPVMRAALATNIELSGFKNLVVHPVGLADQPKRGALQPAHAGNPGSAYFVEGDAEDDIELRVMNSLADQLERLDLIKIDVEGLEISVLRGGAELINARKPSLIAEVNRAALERFGTTAEELFDLLESWGYRPLYVDHGRFRPLVDAQLRARPVYNLLAIHPDGPHGTALTDG